MLAAPQYEEFTYQRRVPEQELLHRILFEHLETFLARAQTETHGLPRHVVKELRDYVECGVLGHGFIRVKCGDCDFERAVAFSCKGRGFCPSCTGRRMSDTAARLVDDVFPKDVPVRQWVLSLPMEIRYRLAYDGKLLSDVLAVFLRVVRGCYQMRARAEVYSDGRFGSVTFAQRFWSALNLNPHFHTLALDGVYIENGVEPKFHHAPILTDEDVCQIVETTAHRVIRLLERRGILDGASIDRLADEEPVLAGVTAASVRGMVATGERAGMRVRRVLSDPWEGVRTGYLCYASRGFSLHAASYVEAGDKDGLERLCRYVARPPLAAGSLNQHSKDLLSFKLKTPWSDPPTPKLRRASSTTHLILSPSELIEKLAALVPSPRKNIVRYHGVLGPNARNRDKIVPGEETNLDDKVVAPKKYRIKWSALLARVFRVDAPKCPRCAGKMKIVAALTDPVSIRQYLKGTGQCADVPALTPARAPPQTEMDFDF